jgi:hypothetical protein
MSDQIAVRQHVPPAGWRPKLGLLLLILALVSPLLAPLVLASGMADPAKRSLAGMLLFGVPMAMIVVVIGLLGQPAFNFIKGLFAGADATSSPVDATRYRIGLALLLLGVLVSWIEPLVSPHYPAIAARRVLVGTLADGVVLASLFVLGGGFWDKVHALFVQDARVVPAGGRVAVYQAIRVTWRFHAGVAVVACSFGAWSLVPIASAAGWSTKQIASLSGAIFIGSKVGLVTAIAIMGKDGFNYLKQLVFGFLSRFAPAQSVGHRRYVLGLVLFLLPVWMTWLEPYVTGLLRPESVYGFLQGLSLEVLLLVGLFLLGGDFWDKLRALFSHGAQVEIVRDGG